MHVGRGEAASKTGAMLCPKPRKLYESESTERIYLDGNGFIDFTKEFRYLGSIITSSLTSDADMEKRIKAATAIFGALSKCIFSRKDIDSKVKGQVYNSTVLSALLYGSEFRARFIKTFSIVYDRSTIAAPDPCAESRSPTL